MNISIAEACIGTVPPTGIPDLPDHPSHDEDNEIDGHTIH